jgi:hypothetical protein
MKISCADYKSGDMQILLHHIYEYKKGLRNLVLHTMSKNEQYLAEELLIRKGIYYIIQDVNDRKINVSFGRNQCVKIVESFGNKSLSDFSDEEDFILGIMLGYDRTQQCDRYMKRKGINTEFAEINRLVNIN